MSFFKKQNPLEKLVVPEPKQESKKKIICIICGEHGNEISCKEYNFNKGWDAFKDKVIELINNNKKNLVDPLYLKHQINNLKKSGAK